MRSMAKLAVALACAMLGAAVTPALANDTTADVLWREATARAYPPSAESTPPPFEAETLPTPYVVAMGPSPEVNRASAGLPRATTPSSGVDCTQIACVALTFDDGPLPETTPRLLQMLDQAGVKATFFVVGHRTVKYPDIVRDELAAGHEVANHTQGHENLLHLTDQEVHSTVYLNQNTVAGADGVAPSLFRPPFGAYNPRVNEIVGRLGLPLVMWDVDTLDWKTRNAASTIAAVQRARPGSIILMHDIHPTSVDAVPQVIDSLQAKGFTLVTVSELLASQKLVSGQVYVHGRRPH